MPVSGITNIPNIYVVIDRDFQLDTKLPYAPLNILAIGFKADFGPFSSASKFSAIFHTTRDKIYALVNVE